MDNLKGKLLKRIEAITGRLHGMDLSRHQEILQKTKEHEERLKRDIAEIKEKYKDRKKPLEDKLRELERELSHSSTNTNNSGAGGQERGQATGAPTGAFTAPAGGMNDTMSQPMSNMIGPTYHGDAAGRSRDRAFSAPATYQMGIVRAEGPNYGVRAEGPNYGRAEGPNYGVQNLFNLSDILNDEDIATGRFFDDIVPPPPPAGPSQ